MYASKPLPLTRAPRFASELTSFQIVASIIGMSRLATSRPVLTVTLLIVALVLSALGNVLCVRADGHAAIEPSHPVSGCEAVGVLASSLNPVVEAASENCVDLPLATVTGMNRLDQEREQFGTPAFDLVPLVYAFDSLPDASVKQFHLSSWPNQNRDSKLIKSLCSTILLL